MTMMTTRLPIERRDVVAVFAARVQQLCDERGWASNHLDDVAGLARGAVRRYLAEGSAPRLDIAYRIAIALDTTLDDLLDPRSPLA